MKFAVEVGLGGVISGFITIGPVIQEAAVLTGK
jgi:hypothetical protein